MKFRLSYSDNSKKTESWLSNLDSNRITGSLDKSSVELIETLKASTPVDSGVTASSWTREVKKRKGSIDITINNTSENKGVSIVRLLNYGHATRGGNYISGTRYVNKAFDRHSKKIDNILGEVIE